MAFLTIDLQPIKSVKTYTLLKVCKDISTGKKKKVGLNKKENENVGGWGVGVMRYRHRKK